MDSGGNTNAQPQATATGGLGSTSSEGEALHTQNPSDHFQSVGETNPETSSSDGGLFLKNMMKPEP